MLWSVATYVIAHVEEGLWYLYSRDVYIYIKCLDSSDVCLNFGPQVDETHILQQSSWKTFTVWDYACTCPHLSLLHCCWVILTYMNYEPITVSIVYLYLPDAQSKTRLGLRIFACTNYGIYINEKSSVM